MASEQKNIKIYLATANDLEPEHKEIVILVEELNKIFNRRHVHLELIPHNKEKSEIHECELSLALYYTKFGDYSKNDFKSAYNSLKKGENPKKIYVFFKDTEQITQDLKDFKDNFVTEFGHFFCKFENVDTLKLNFFMQIEIYQNNHRSEHKVEIRNNKLYFDTYELVDLDKIPFVTNNADYIRMREEIIVLGNEVEDLRLKITQYPKDKSFVADLQEKLNARNILEEIFTKHQEILYSIATHIAQTSHKNMSDRLHRAMIAFENGFAYQANVILAEAEYDADIIINDYKMHKASLEKVRELIELSIEELMLKAEVVMADTDFTIDERIELAKKAYKKAKEVALEIKYSDEKMDILLFEYARFLSKYGFHRDAEGVYLEQIILAKKLYSKKSVELSMSYNNIGVVYLTLGEHKSALKFLKKAKMIRKKELGLEHTFTSTSYNNLAELYRASGDYKKALKYYKKALIIDEKVLGLEHPYTALTYNNIGEEYRILEDYKTALNYYEKALSIWEITLGLEHPYVAATYNNIGLVHHNLNELKKALCYYHKSLEICKKMLGSGHSDTAKSYNNIGAVYHYEENLDKALEYYQKSLEILEKLNVELSSIATTYYNIAEVYNDKGEYENALINYEKSLKICQGFLDKSHPYTIRCCDSIIYIYYELLSSSIQNNEYNKAKKYCTKALLLLKYQLGKDHSDTIECAERLKFIEEIVNQQN